MALANASISFYLPFELAVIYSHADLSDLDIADPYTVVDQLLLVADLVADSLDLPAPYDLDQHVLDFDRDDLEQADLDPDTVEIAESACKADLQAWSIAAWTF